MSIPTYHGSDLEQLVVAQLGGYQSAVDDTLIYSFLNEGKNEVWMVLKTLGEDYFGTSSQNTDPTQDNYFGQLSTTKREYSLPNDCREVRFIECTDVGFEDTQFEYRKLSSTDFKDARRANTNNILNPDSNQVDDVYYYTIVGKNTFMLAEFPEQPFHLTMWYDRVLPDFTATDPVDEIIYPFVQKVAEYAVKKIMAVVQDLPLEEAWRQIWRDSIQRIAASGDPRDSSIPIFVDDFMGYSIES